MLVLVQAVATPLAQSPWTSTKTKTDSKVTGLPYPYLAASPVAAPRMATPADIAPRMATPSGRGNVRVGEATTLFFPSAQLKA